MKPHDHAFSMRSAPPAVWSSLVIAARLSPPHPAAGDPGSPGGARPVFAGEMEGVLRRRSRGGGAFRPEPWKDKRESGYRDGPGKGALFKSPRGPAIDREGNLLVADEGNCALRKIDPAGNVTTIHKGCTMEGADRPEGCSTSGPFEFVNRRPRRSPRRGLCLFPTLPPRCTATPSRKQAPPREIPWRSLSHPTQWIP